jgi:hypothetical protein
MAAGLITILSAPDQDRSGRDAQRLRSSSRAAYALGSEASVLR